VAKVVQLWCEYCHKKMEEFDFHIAKGSNWHWHIQCAPKNIQSCFHQWEEWQPEHKGEGAKFCPLCESFKD
jgi:hypothetical protein